MQHPYSGYSLIPETTTTTAKKHMLKIVKTPKHYSSSPPDSQTGRVAQAAMFLLYFWAYQKVRLPFFSPPFALCLPPFPVAFYCKYTGNGLGCFFLLSLFLPAVFSWWQERACLRNAVTARVTTIKNSTTYYDSLSFKITSLSWKVTQIVSVRAVFVKLLH